MLMFTLSVFSQALLVLILWDLGNKQPTSTAEEAFEEIVVEDFDDEAALQARI